jgi:hypothetical protein
MTWISVNDRLPTKDGTYYVIRQWSEVFFAYMDNEFKDGSFVNKTDAGDFDEIAGPIIDWFEE